MHGIQHNHFYAREPRTNPGPWFWKEDRGVAPRSFLYRTRHHCDCSVRNVWAAFDFLDGLKLGGLPTVTLPS